MRYIDKEYVKVVIGQAINQAVESLPKEVLMDNTILSRLSSNIVKAFKAADDELIKIEETK